MQLLRRQFIGLAASTAAMPLLPQDASALEFPSRPVHVIIGFPPGGTLDTISRLIGQRLSERLGQPFLIESRPGAASNIAAEYVLHAPADGYTLLACTSTNTINASLYQRLNFDFPRDIVPVSGMTLTPAVMEVAPMFPAKTVAEFVAYAKLHPGEINMGSPGVGTFHHVAGELFMMLTGTKLVHVPYHGEAPALMDLLAGQIQVMFTLLPSSIAHIRSGALRALGVTIPKRLGELPDVPTVAETVPGYEANSWQGLVAPSGAPADIVEILNGEVTAALADAKIKGRLVDLGAQVLTGSSTDFGRFIAAETDKWRRVIQTANIKAEQN